MAWMIDVMFYTFREGDPDGMPGVEGETYGFVGATSRGRAELAACPAGTQVGDIFYAADEATVGTIYEHLSEELVCA